MSSRQNNSFTKSAQILSIKRKVGAGIKLFMKVFCIISKQTNFKDTSRDKNHWHGAMIYAWWWHVMASSRVASACVGRQLAPVISASHQSWGADHWSPVKLIPGHSDISQSSPDTRTVRTVTSAAVHYSSDNQFASRNQDNKSDIKMFSSPHPALRLGLPNMAFPDSALPSAPHVPGTILVRSFNIKD